MKTPKEVYRWLQANLGKRCLAPLTSTDNHALLASVALCPLISYRGAADELFAAYRAIVLQMQEHNRPLAYHAIAMELDWSHRRMIWEQAGLAGQIPLGRCVHES